MSNQRPWLYPVLAGIAVIVVILVISACASISLVSTDGGHVAVVRNGSGLVNPFNNSRIRDVIQPGSSKKWEGFNSQTHSYPASQRYYTITAIKNGGDRPGVDVFQGSTADGINDVGIEGTVQFTLNTDNTTLRKFDNEFGTRTFPVRGTSDALHPWEGDSGWSAFLDAVFRNQVLDPTLRVEIQKFKCVDLVPSCAYVKSTVAGVTPVIGQQANTNLVQFQTDIAKSLQSDLDATLGGQYLKISGFVISKVSLPTGISQEIDNANQSKVKVQTANFAAQQQVAVAIGQKNAQLQEAEGVKALNAAYANSKAKAGIDAIKALPPNLTTLVIGGNSGLSQLVGK